MLVLTMNEFWINLNLQLNAAVYYIPAIENFTSN